LCCFVLPLQQVSKKLLIQNTYETGVVVLAFNSSTPEAEARGWSIQVSLGYIRDPVSNKNKNKNHKTTKNIQKQQTKYYRTVFVSQKAKDSVA
jgi:hypothetical protein